MIDEMITSGPARPARSDQAAGAMLWSELEGKLSDRKPAAENRFNAAKFSKDGGDSPPWSQHRAPYAPPPFVKAQRLTGPVTP